MDTWIDGGKEGRKEGRMDGFDAGNTLSTMSFVIEYSQEMEYSGYHNILIDQELLPQYDSQIWPLITDYLEIGGKSTSHFK